MIHFELNNRKKLDSKSIRELNKDKIVCYTLVGGTPKGTEGDVYIFYLDENSFEVYCGNIYSDYLCKDDVYGLIPELDGFFDKKSIKKCKMGWTGIGYVTGHYVFLDKDWADDIQKIWQIIDMNNYFDKLYLSLYHIIIINKMKCPDEPAGNTVAFNDIWNKIICLVGDITIVNVDAIVNSANHSLSKGGGVNGAIHKAAGAELLEECRKLKGCNTGEAKLTNGYNLLARYIIHTVGPDYENDTDSAKLLAQCYNNSLKLAKENEIHSIAFPAISTGKYGYPKDKAAIIAIKTVFKWLLKNKEYDIKIYFVSNNSETNTIMSNKVESIKFHLDEKWS